MNILFIGDVFGSPGRQAVQKLLPDLKKSRAIDLVIANGENLAHGKGVTEKGAEVLLSAGVDVITTGNHAFDVAESHHYYNKQKKILRPANYPKGNPGKGSIVLEVYGGVHVAVINLIGRIHMAPVDCPFEAADQTLEEVQGKADITFVDMHAETTSETRAMGWYLDGKVAAVIGSHTHVQTADEEVLPGGTAYLTDAGMTGPYRSVIGMEIEPVLQKFRTGMRSRFQPATEDVRLCGALIEVEESNGLARKIERIQMKV